MSQEKLIGTHSGTFHCDEALAIYMLRCLDEFKNAKVVRSRDAAVWDTCAILVDVGAVYDVKKCRFDHHQRGFEETFNNNEKTKLSSAGLIYKHYGKEFVSNVSGLKGSQLDTTYLKVYKTFIEAIDGIDNGVFQYPEHIASNYSINTGLSSRVGKLNPNWNEEEVDLEQRFEQASKMAGEELVAEILYRAKSWLPARSIVQAALEGRTTHHQSGQIVVMPQHCPWQEHLLDLEEEMGVAGLVKYVLYTDQAGAWRVQAVPAAKGSFQSRLALPEPWRGVRDESLSTLTGIKGCIFVHAGGFIGGNANFEGVLEMASNALDFAAESPQAKKIKA